MAYDDYNGMMGGDSSGQYDWLTNYKQPDLVFDMNAATGGDTAAPSWGSTPTDNQSGTPQYRDLSNYTTDDSGSYTGGYTDYSAPASDSSWDAVWAGAKNAIAPKGWEAALGGRIADFGAKSLASWLSPKQDTGNANAMSSQMMASLEKFNKMNDLQAAQYSQNVPTLQNVATSNALVAANPTERANRASADFTLFSNARRKQREQQLAAAGTRPGSPEWVSAMADLDQADAIGHADAYNKGLQTAYDAGSQQLTSAYAMHPAPNYSGATASAGTGAYQQAALAKLQNDMRASNVTGWTDILTDEYNKKRGLAGPTGG